MNAGLCRASELLVIDGCGGVVVATDGPFQWFAHNQRPLIRSRERSQARRNFIGHRVCGPWDMAEVPWHRSWGIETHYCGLSSQHSPKLSYYSIGVGA